MEHLKSGQYACKRFASIATVGCPAREYPQVECRCLISPLLKQSNHRRSTSWLTWEIFLCLFSSPIPCMEINLAEVFAIHRAIKIYQNSNVINGRDLIIESDSANAVNWCTNKKVDHGTFISFWTSSVTVHHQQVISQSRTKAGHRTQWQIA